MKAFLTPEEVRDDYLPINTLGSGADGVVTRYSHKRVLKCYIAVKKPLERQRECIQSIQKEIATMKKIGYSPYVVDMLGYEDRSIESGPSIFFEFMDLGDAWDYQAAMCKAFGHVPEESIWKFYSDVVQGLHHLHQSPAGPLVHGDLKPPNIMVCRQAGDTTKFPVLPIFKLADFGRTVSFSSTNPQRYHGTYEWAPTREEQKLPLNPAMDMWALGACIQSMALNIYPVPHWDDVIADYVRKNGARHAPTRDDLSTQQWRSRRDVIWRGLDQPFLDRDQNRYRDHVYSSALERWYAMLFNKNPVTRLDTRALMAYLVPVAEAQIRVLQVRRKVKDTRERTAREEKKLAALAKSGSSEEKQEKKKKKW